MANNGIAGNGSATASKTDHQAIGRVDHQWRVDVGTVALTAFVGGQNFRHCVSNAITETNVFQERVKGGAVGGTQQHLSLLIGELIEIDFFILQRTTEHAPT